MSKRNKRNKEYWEKRALEAEARKHKRVIKTGKELKDLMNRYKFLLKRKIIYWATQFGQNNDLAMSEALQYLTREELADLKYDVWEYIELANKSEQNDKTEMLIKNISTKYHLTRLDALALQIEACISLLTIEEIDIIKKHLLDLYYDSYLTTVYELAKGFDVRVNLYMPNAEKIKILLDKPWTDDGIEFSERIWGKHRERLVKELRHALEESLTVGKNAVKMADELAKSLDVNKSQAEALLQTESAVISEKARTKCFEDLDVDKYIIVATLDHKTSEICREMDGKIFDTKKEKIGKNAPPFHVRCRTTKAPYIDYIYGIGERAARDKKGKTIYVPDDMTYHEFYKKYIESDKEYSAVEKVWKNKHSDKKQFKKYKKLGYDGVKSFDDFQKIKYNDTKEWDMVKGYAGIVQKGEISPLVGYNNFKEYHKKLENKLIGLKFNDGLEVKGISYHFTSRAIGTHDWVSPSNSKEIMKRLNHKHVPDYDLIKCIEKGNVFKKTNASTVFYFDRCQVTINQHTGNLIQCNRL